MKVINILLLLFTFTGCYGVMYVRADKKTPINELSRIRVSPRSTIIVSINEDFMPDGSVHNADHYDSFLVTPGDKKLMVHYHHGSGRYVTSSKEPLPLEIKIKAGETMYICGKRNNQGWFPYAVLVPYDVPNIGHDPKDCF